MMPVCKKLSSCLVSCDMAHPFQFLGEKKLYLSRSLLFLVLLLCVGSALFSLIIIHYFCVVSIFSGSLPLLVHALKFDPHVSLWRVQEMPRLKAYVCTQVIFFARGYCLCVYKSNPILPKSFFFFFCHLFFACFYLLTCAFYPSPSLSISVFLSVYLTACLCGCLSISLSSLSHSQIISLRILPPPPPPPPLPPLSLCYIIFFQNVLLPLSFYL